MNNTVKRLWITAIAAAVVFSACGGGGGAPLMPVPIPVAVTDVSLDKTSVNLTVGDTETLTATVLPADATNKNVTWTSSNDSVATVSDGTVTAIDVGTATVTVTTADGNKTAACAVTVTAGVPVTGVTLDKTGVTLATGSTATLIATVAPPDATNKNVSWASSDTGVATVANGTVTAKAAGTATITVTTANGNKTAACTVTVTGGSGSIIEMVRIPAGTFIMGSPTTEPNRSSIDETQHSVTLTKSFYMGKYQVTQAQYQAVMGAGEDRTTTTYGKGGNYPIYNVNWYDALVFCNKLSVMEGFEPVYSIGGSTDPADWGIIPTSWNETWNAAVMDTNKNGYRLPTEAEWEYACRGDYPNKATETNTKPFGIGDGTKMVSGMANFNARYPYDLAQSGQYNAAIGTYLGKTTGVGSYTANNYGLYDMHGNLDEWCWDWYEADITTDNTDPTGAVTGLERVVRGGFWLNSGQFLRSAKRNDVYPNYRDYDIDRHVGIRLVRS